MGEESTVGRLQLTVGWSAPRAGPDHLSTAAPHPRTCRRHDYGQARVN
jgi:hypothetical protein